MHTKQYLVLVLVLLGSLCSCNESNPSLSAEWPLLGEDKAMVEQILGHSGYTLGRVLNFWTFNSKTEMHSFRTQYDSVGSLVNIFYNIRSLFPRVIDSSFDARYRERAGLLGTAIDSTVSSPKGIRSYTWQLTQDGKRIHIHIQKGQEGSVGCWSFYKGIRLFTK